MNVLVQCLVKASAFTALLTQGQNSNFGHACLGDVVRDTGLLVVRGGAVRVGVDFAGVLARSASGSTAGGAGGASSARSARAVMRDDTLAPSWRGSLHGAFQTILAGGCCSARTSHHAQSLVT